MPPKIGSFQPRHCRHTAVNRTNYLAYVSRWDANSIRARNMYRSHGLFRLHPLPHWRREFWMNTFGDDTFHGIPMELHVPCRDRIDHLMSQCNHFKTRKKLDCDAFSDEAFFKSIKKCFIHQVKQRYNHTMAEHFDSTRTINCFDVKKQFLQCILSTWLTSSDQEGWNLHLL
jgi:hypothetical protein